MNTNFNFRATAVEATTLSRLMNDRSKKTTEEVIIQYPEGITITEFDRIVTEKDDYYICVFAEEPTAFMNCGFVLGKIMDAWVAAFEGSITDASDSLRESGGVKVRLARGRAKNGNNITTVTVL